MRNSAPPASKTDTVELAASVHNDRTEERTIGGSGRPSLSLVRSEPGMAIGGRYRLLELLGRGAMGEVWRAQDSTLRAQVAVKLLLPKSGAAGRIAQSRFRFEAQVAARLAARTVHVVTVHDAGYDPDAGPYVVMEYVRGRTLRQLLTERGTITLAEVEALLEQITEALALAHRQGIIHRDLKPSNLLLTESLDGKVCVKIADFGLAKALRRDISLDMPPPTAYGTVLGTLSYISPEQFQGLPVDHQADLWSLATIVYESLTGRAPFQGRTPAQVLKQLLLSTAPPPSSIRAGLPRGLDRWFARAFARDPSDRFHSVEQMVEAFRCALAAPVASPAAEQPRRARSWHARRTERALVAVALATAALTSAVVLRPPAQPEGRDAKHGAEVDGGAPGAIRIVPEAPSVTWSADRPEIVPAGANAAAASAAAVGRVDGGSARPAVSGKKRAPAAGSGRQSRPAPAPAPEPAPSKDKGAVF